MTELREADSWEEFEQMTLNPTPTVALCHTDGEDKRSKEQESQPNTPKEETLSGETIDQALKEALKNPRERANVLRIDAEVFKFISDKTRCTIDFSYDLTSYQVGNTALLLQMYGLQTSSVPAGNGLSRVIAHKTQNTKPPPVRVVDVMDVYCPPEAAKKAAPPEMTIKRRQDASGGAGMDGHGDSLFSNSAGNNRSVKQREEEYREARDRILGDAQYNEQEEQAPREEGEEDGKNTKAVFRDRLKELQDPDYRRGAAKGYQKQPAYNGGYSGERGTYVPENKGNAAGGGVYAAPAYHSEFPALPVVTGDVSQPHRPFLPPAQHVYMPPEQQMAPTKAGFPPPPAMNYRMTNPPVPRRRLGTVQYPAPTPVSSYAAYHPRPPQFRLPGEPITAAIAGATQPMLMQGWKQPHTFPPPQTAATAPPVTTPPQHNVAQQNYAMYATFQAYPQYPRYAPGYQARYPYRSIVQGDQQRPHGVAPDGGVHAHQMTTIQRKPVSNSQNDGVQQSGR